MKWENQTQTASTLPTPTKLPEKTKNKNKKEGTKDCAKKKQQSNQQRETSVRIDLERLTGGDIGRRKHYNQAIIKNGNLLSC
jgi:hypothetical protein